MSGVPIRDIHLPSAISWWPPAIGWWIVLIGSVVLACLLFFLLRKLFQQTIKKQALSRLKSIEKTFDETRDAHLCLADISYLLRQVSVAKEPSLAGVTGKEWLRCLDEKMKEPSFSKGVGEILLTGPYQKNTSLDHIVEVLAISRKWVEAL